MFAGRPPSALCPRDPFPVPSPGPGPSSQTVADPAGADGVELPEPPPGLQLCPPSDPSWEPAVKELGGAAPGAVHAGQPPQRHRHGGRHGRGPRHPRRAPSSGTHPINPPNPNPPFVPAPDPSWEPAVKELLERCMQANRPIVIVTGGHHGRGPRHPRRATSSGTHPINPPNPRPALPSCPPLTLAGSRRSRSSWSGACRPTAPSSSSQEDITGEARATLVVRQAPERIRSTPRTPAPPFLRARP